MKVALDAMGGDHAPREIVEGAVRAARSRGTEVVLVGDTASVQAELNRVTHGSIPPTISIHHTTEVIGMGEAPATACKTKKDSSIMVSARLAREGKVTGFVSAGNTGACMTASFLVMGRLEGVQRPAIPVPIPHRQGVTVVLDAGANVDARAQHLAQWAVMGEVYSEKIFGVSRPRIGLLNVGEEEGKGGEVVNEAYELLKGSKLNFIGNIEGRDIVNGKVDVVVCDGFVGNVVLKLAEGVGRELFDWLKDSYKAAGPLAKLGAYLSMPVFRNIKKAFDPATYGAQPLLGVDGICMITHGSASALAIDNALKVAETYYSQNANNEIKERLKASGLGRGSQA